MTDSELRQLVTAQNPNLPAFAERIVERHAREVIASQGDLARHGIEVLQVASARIGDGLEGLRVELKRAGSRLDYGLDAIFRSSEAIRESLQDLLKSAQTPSQTFAYEQYEIARDALRRSLYADSLRALQRATEGDHANTGYDLDFRFHLMKGRILLGRGLPEQDRQRLQDVPAAEQAFARSAECARSDHAKDAAVALELAAEAALGQGIYEQAEGYLSSAIELDPEAASLWFSSARANAQLGNLVRAEHRLTKAISMDRKFFLDAFSEGGGLLNHSEWLNGWLHGQVASAKHSAEASKEKWLRTVEHASTWRVPMNQYALALARCELMLSSGTLFGYQDAEQEYRELTRKLTSVVDYAPTQLRKDLSAQATEVSKGMAGASAADYMVANQLSTQRSRIEELQGYTEPYRNYKTYRDHVREVESAAEALTSVRRNRAPITAREDEQAAYADAFLGCLKGGLQGALMGLPIGLLTLLLSAIVIGILGLINDWPDGNAGTWAQRLSVVAFGLSTIVGAATGYEDRGYFVRNRVKQGRST